MRSLSPLESHATTATDFGSAMILVMVADLLDLIDSDPSVAHGQARFRGTRVPVSVVLDCLAAGMTDAEIHDQYPSLPVDATPAAHAYAARVVREEW
jgi:uncharacterized protein (DUF433 family)